MKKLLFFGIAACGVLTFAACDRNVNDNLDRRYKILTESNWKYEKINVNASADPIPGCKADDVFIFATDGMGYINADQVRCNPTTGGGENGNDTTQFVVPGTEDITFDWSMTGDNTTIHIHNFGPEKKDIEYLITDMDYDHMTVKYSEFVNGTHFVYEITFKPVGK